MPLGSGKNAEARDQAQQILAAMADGKYKRQAMRNIAAGKRTSPRPFFWKST